ncbi:hypothetical protein OSTOST_24078 [Ostertagia ostertagi]
MNKLLGWLKDWGRNNLGEGGKTKKPKPPPFLAQTDGAPFKAVLLSGSPGVGKTTCAVMACETPWHEDSGDECIGCTKQEEPRAADDEVKHVLIMDEVDGMSGTEDRAGIAELIQIIKESKIPIICIVTIGSIRR